MSESKMICLSASGLREVWGTTVFVGFGIGGAIQALVSMEWERVGLLLIVSGLLALSTLRTAGLHDWTSWFGFTPASKPLQGQQQTPAEGHRAG